MNAKRSVKGPAMQLERAQYEVEQAKKKFASTLGTLQYRLKPGTLANHAWEGVREKSSEAADGAFVAVNELAESAAQAARARPAAAGGIAAAAFLFLVRAPLGRLASRLFRGKEDAGLVKTDLSNADDNYDLTAPVAARTTNQGVSA